jgi:hypothetical protein
VGDAQRLAGLLLAATRARELADEHDEDWFRNPRAIDQLRAETRVVPATTCTPDALQAGVHSLTHALTSQL